MNFIGPTGWGARINYDSKDWRPWNPDKWVVHYGGGATRGAYDGVDREKAVLRAWEWWHLDGRGWAGIAYNYAIGMSGTVYRLRGEQRSAATSGDIEPDGIPENYEARAVVFIMGGHQIPTSAALQAFTDLHQSFPDLPVIVHSDVRGTSYTSCPGTFLRVWVHRKEYYEKMQFTEEEEKILKEFARGIKQMSSEGHGFAVSMIKMIRGMRKLYRQS